MVEEGGLSGEVCMKDSRKRDVKIKVILDLMWYDSFVIISFYFFIEETWMLSIWKISKMFIEEEEEILEF